YIGSLPPRQTVQINAASSKPLSRLESYDPSSGWSYGAPVVTWDGYLAQLLIEREWADTVYLLAQASEPVLAPELRDDAKSAAQVMYLISLPLEGAQ
ncbi:MAG: hypothetical protein ACK4RG_06885, partial [Fimbriimonadales bacterium]